MPINCSVQGQIDKNMDCQNDKSSKTCQCNAGLYFNWDKMRCEKYTRAMCDADCKAAYGRGSFCTNLQECDCIFDGPGKYFVFSDRYGVKGPVRCVPFKYMMCDAECKEENGRKAQCSKRDFGRCELA